MNSVEETDGTTSRGRLIKRSLLAFLILTNTILFVTTFVYKSRQDASNKELLSKDELVLEMEATLEKTETQLIKYRDLSQELNTLLKAANDQIEKLKKEIEALKKSRSDDPVLRKRFTRLKATADRYLESIDSLVEANQQLAFENEQLRQNILDVKDLNEVLMEQNQDLEIKLNIYSKPKVENILIGGINIDSKGEELHTTNINRINTLKVCFDIAENNKVKPEEKRLYMQIIDPNGRVLSSDNNTRTTFKLDDSSIEYEYTDKVRIMHDETRKNVCIYSERMDKYIAGIYKVKIFVREGLIGSSVIELQ